MGIFLTYGYFSFLRFYFYVQDQNKTDWFERFIPQVKLDTSMLVNIKNDFEFCMKLVSEESVLLIPGAYRFN